MRRTARIAVQTLLVCASAIPFVAVAPRVIDAHHARHAGAPTTATAAGTSAGDLRRPLRSVSVDLPLR